MTRWVYSQSDSTEKALRQHGCGAYTAVNALVRASDGAWRPQGKAGTTSAQVRRERSGVSEREFERRGMTSQEVFVSLVDVRESGQRMNLPVQWRRGVSVRGALLPQLDRTGACAAVPVDYGRVQDARLGVGGYRGGHWVLVDAPDDGRVRVADPLRDRIVTWPIDVLVDAMEHFGTRPWLRGRGEAIVVWPWQTWKEGYGAMKAQRDALKVALAACEARP